MKILALICIFLISITSHADSLKSISLPDQFDQSTTIDENTQWVIFSNDKDMSDNINKALEDLKITDIKSLNGAYVSDISRMPSMITKMFALPKMQKYTFKVLLDKEGDLTSKWPQEKGKVSLMTLEKLEIKSVEKTVSFENIKKFLESKLNLKTDSPTELKKEGK